MKNENGELMKQTYFSALDRCSQDVDTVSENVIKQMKTDFPSLEYLYRKSDNAGCFAGNGVAENEYYICLKNGIMLLRNVSIKRFGVFEDYQSKSKRREFCMLFSVVLSLVASKVSIARVS